MDRTEVVQAFLSRAPKPTYLEIGICTGYTFLRVRAHRKLAVDPAPRVSAWKRFRWRVRNPSNWGSRIYRMTSDDFFARPAGRLFPAGLDVAFIDGLHTYEQSLRDVDSCLTVLNPCGVVLLHDCSPPSAGAATPAGSPDEAREAAGTAWDGMWCGDVFKTILHLRSQRHDLRTCVLDCDRGIGVVRRAEAEERISLDRAQIDSLGYAELAEHRRHWLGLRPPEALNELLYPESYSTR